MQEFDLHTSLMRDFLADTNENCIKYADGTAALDKPLPVRLSWQGENRHFKLKIAENPDMTGAWEFETDETSYDVYNLKIGTTYYWTVEAEINGKMSQITDSGAFVTVDAAPRTLSIGGKVINARDIGGWNTADGKRVKQGLLYRMSAFDGFDGNKTVSFLTPSGRHILKDMLGIKTEIDLRVDHETEAEYPPNGKTSSALGEDTAYYHCPILLGGENYLKSADSIKTIFRVLANPDSYPIVCHCAVGADRTGGIIYLVLGLIGVKYEDLVRDYMFTNFSYQQKYRPPVKGMYVETLDNYHGATLSKKIYNYLANEIGVSCSDLDFIKNYLTE